MNFLDKALKGYRQRRFVQKVNKKLVLSLFFETSNFKTFD